MRASVVRIVTALATRAASVIVVSVVSIVVVVVVVVIGVVFVLSSSFPPHLQSLKFQALAILEKIVLYLIGVFGVEKLQF